MPFYGTVLGKQKITLCFASYPSRVGKWGVPQFALPIARRSWQTVCQNIPWPRDNQVYALTTHQLQVERRERDRANQVYALTTHQLQVERRESHRANQVYASPHTSYRWRGERVIEPIKCMRSPHTSYRWRGEREIEPIKCMRSPHTSYRWRGERVIETIKCMLSPHTSYRWRGERVTEPIKWMGIIMRPWLTRASGANLARTPGLHIYSLREVSWDFNYHSESGPRFNVSSERRGFWEYSIPVTTLGR